MSIIEEFMQFHKAVDPTRRSEVENILRMIMNAESTELNLSPEQLAEDDRRFNDPNNLAVPHADIEAIAGMKMPS